MNIFQSIKNRKVYYLLHRHVRITQLDGTVKYGTVFVDLDSPAQELMVITNDQFFEHFGITFE